MAIKYTNIFHCKTLQIYPNGDFGFKNMPSGNPASEYSRKLARKIGFDLFKLRKLTCFGFKRRIDNDRVDFIRPLLTAYPRD
jgi:hypothetical protein